MIRVLFEIGLFSLLLILMDTYYLIKYLEIEQQYRKKLPSNNEQWASLRQPH